MKKEVAVGTVIQYAQRSNNNHTPRWDRTQRAQLFDQYLALQAQGLSLRQAAKALEVPRSTLQAWRSYQESLETAQGLAVDLPSILAPGPTSLRVRSGVEKQASIMGPATWPR